MTVTVSEFALDFWEHYKIDLQDAVDIPHGASVGYALYVGLTNVGIASLYGTNPWANMARLLRSAESVAASYATGAKPADLENVAYSAALFIAAGLLLSSNPGVVGAVALPLLAFAGGIVSFGLQY